MVQRLGLATAMLLISILQEDNEVNGQPKVVCLVNKKVRKLSKV